MSLTEPRPVDAAEDAPPSPQRLRRTWDVAVLVKMHRNPYGELLYGALAEHGFRRVAEAQLEASWLWRNRGRIPFLHFHWDQGFTESTSEVANWRELRSWLKTAGYVLLLMLARLLGYRLIWTVHEVVPHEPRNPRRDLIAARILARTCHALMAHDSETAARVTSRLRPGNKPVVVIGHGSFDGIYPPGRPRAVVREEWKISEQSFVFLAFGNLRRYKRLDLLLEAFSRVRDPNAVLLIAGEFLWRLPEPEWEAAMAERLRDAAARDPRIRYRISRVPTADVAELHGACDAVVLARSDGWTSGSMILAMGQGLPVIAARQPAYVELAGEDCGYFYTPGSADALAEAMTFAALDPDVQAKGAEARLRASTLDWQRPAAQTAALMLATLPPSRR